MGDIIDFEKPRPPLSPEEQHFNSIVRALQDMAPQERISAIAASCGGDDWWELFKLAVYSIGEENYTALSEKVQDKEELRKAIAYPLHCTLRGVIEEATGAAP